MLLSMPENLTMLHTNNKGSDQTAYLRSLISAFYYSLNIIVEAVVCQNSTFKLVAVAEQAKLSINQSETRRQVFLRRGPFYGHERLFMGVGAQWISGIVLNSRPKGRGFELQRRHCVVSLINAHLSLLSTG